MILKVGESRFRLQDVDPCCFFKVAKVLKDLDLDKIKTAQAKNLSGGQKRKLSVGIAILGDPKVTGINVSCVITFHS